MKALFTSGDRAQDLIDWARRINFLGAAIAEIGDGDGSYTLPVLGEIIQDYAGALEVVFNEFYTDIRKVVGDFEYPEMVEIVNTYKRLIDCDCDPEIFLRSDWPHTILGKIETFKDKIGPVFDIEEDLKKRLNGISKKKPAKINQEHPVADLSSRHPIADHQAQ